MTVEITGFSFINKELHLFATNADERHLQILERNRFDDGSEQELEFIFDKDNINYLYKWLKRQKAVKTAAPKTLGQAVNAVLGTVTTLSGKYLDLAS